LDFKQAIDPPATYDSAVKDSLGNLEFCEQDTGSMEVYLPERNRWLAWCGSDAKLFRRKGIIRGQGLPRERNGIAILLISRAACASRQAVRSASSRVLKRISQNLLTVSGDISVQTWDHGSASGNKGSASGYDSVARTGGVRSVWRRPC